MILNCSKIGIGSFFSFDFGSTFAFKKIPIASFMAQAVIMNVRRVILMTVQVGIATINGYF